MLFILNQFKKNESRSDFYRIHINIKMALINENIPIFGAPNLINKKTMKKTLLTVIITLLVAAALIFASHAIWGDGECIFSNDDDKTECTQEEKEKCCDKEHAKKECTEKKDHGKLCDSFKPIRAEFDAELSDEEKATIAETKAKFEDIDHEEMCPEGKEKFMEEHKADFKELLAIADNHKGYFDDLHKKMQEKHEKECKHEEDGDEGEHDEGDGHDDDAVAKKGHECPEASKCKEATEKCKGEPEKEATKECKEKAEKECKEAKEECEKECMNTFLIHFLLLDFE